ncbi:uncharacterized protein [Panulirus ornatus]|uniref:uncharacterized protein n=1 Tax=Panulirus ornatus TaxID=150431 RepID=UPI003A8C37FA
MSAAADVPSSHEVKLAWSSELQMDVEENLDVALPHTSYLFLGIHHGIADGYTAMTICGLIIKLLNDVIEGTTIDDEELYGYAPDLSSSLVANRVQMIESNPEMKHFLFSEMRQRSRWRSAFDQVFTVPEEVAERSRHINYCLSEYSTTQFIEKCRSEGVEVHSGFSALANVALMELLVEKGIILDNYFICSSQTVDMRRYWGGDSSQFLLGCHVTPLHLWMGTPRNIMATFWELARSFQEAVDSAVSTGMVMDEEAIQRIVSPAPPDFNRAFRMPAIRQTDYYMVNLGDVTPLVTEGGPHVRVERIVNSISIKKGNIACSHFVHTFRGRLTHTLDYSTKFMTKELAKRYSDKIFQRMRELF